MAFKKKQTASYDFAHPLDYTQIIFERIKETAEKGVNDPKRYYSSVMMLRTLLVPYIVGDPTKKDIQGIITNRNNELANQPETHRKDSDFMVEWNSGTAELIFEELMLLISRCGFLPEKVVDLVLESDGSFSVSK